MSFQDYLGRQARTSIVPKGVTAFAKACLPDPAYRGLVKTVQICRRTFLYGCAAAAGLSEIGKGAGLPEALLYFGRAPGDDLLCTAVLHELKKRQHSNVWMVSNHPDLFNGNSDVGRVVPVDWHHGEFARLWHRRVRRLEYAPYDGKDYSIPPRRHIIAELCASAGLTGEVALQPYLRLTDEEKAQAEWAKGRIAIQSSGLAARFSMQNKEWFPPRFQAVVNKLRPDFQFVQLGSLANPLLENTRDMRGATSIRNAAAILHHSRLYIGTVGFLMHLARAVECPSVVVYGGREAPWQSGYTCNANLYADVECAPCWRWNTCEYERRCMNQITVDDVVRAVRALADAPRNRLAVEFAEID